MTKYIIKTTYLEGPHEGKVSYVTKHGCVLIDAALNHVWHDDAYDTEAACKRACTLRMKHIEVQRRIELKDRERRIQQGKPVSKYRLYYLERYEPFAIETLGE
jgi:hypothetical protein